MLSNFTVQPNQQTYHIVPTKPNQKNNFKKLEIIRFFRPHQHRAVVRHGEEKSLASFWFFLKFSKFFWNSQRAVFLGILKEQFSCSCDNLNVCPQLSIDSADTCCWIDYTQGIYSYILEGVDSHLTRLQSWVTCRKFWEQRIF